MYSTIIIFYVTDSDDGDLSSNFSKSLVLVIECTLRVFSFIVVDDSVPGELFSGKEGTVWVLMFLPDFNCCLSKLDYETQEDGVFDSTSLRASG